MTDQATRIEGRKQKEVTRAEAASKPDGLKDVSFPSKEMLAAGQHFGRVWFWRDGTLRCMWFDSHKIREIEETVDQLCFWVGDRPFRIKRGDRIGALQRWLAEVAPIDG